MTKRHVLVLEAKRDNLPVIAAFIEEQLDGQGISEKEIFEVGLAVDEACSNIILHGYGEEGGRIEIELAVSPDRVTVSLMDSGEPFNPLTVEPPDLCDDVDQRKVGGLGVFIIKKTMDEVGYEYRNGRNVLSITKNRSDRAGD